MVMGLLTRNPNKLEIGDRLDLLSLTDATGTSILIRDDSRLVHLQFRRFSGCVFCNIHLREFEKRHEEIAAAGICEVILFRSTAEQIYRPFDEVPYQIVLDPKGILYRRFGVDHGLRAILDPRAAVMILPHLIRSLLTSRIRLPAEGGGPLHC